VPDLDPEAVGRAGGNGLRGLTERLVAAGGDLKFGPREAGGYRLEASLPVAST
jgi:two-component system sensor histidine kinase DesK